MYLVIRIIRGLFGLVAAAQLVQALAALLALSKPSTDTNTALAAATVAFVLVAIFGGLFFLLRALINRMHKSKHGTPHPALVKPWNL
jgi:hypothetical protein